MMFRLENRLINILSWIHCVLLFSGFYLVFAGILGKNEQEALGIWLESLWLFVPVAGSWIFIRKIRGFLTYVLAGAGMTVVLAVLSRNILTVVLAVAILVIRCQVRVIQGNMKDLPGEVEVKELWEIPTLLDWPKAFHWFVFIALYLALIFFKRNYLLFWMFGLFLAEILVTYVFNSLEGMRNYVVSNQRIAHLPVKSIQRMQRMVLICTLIVLVIFILPSIFYGEEPLTILANLNFNFDVPLDEVAESMGLMEGPSYENMAEMFGVEPQERNELLETVLNILAYGMAAVIFIALIWAGWHFYRRMMYSFAKGHEEDEVIWLDEEEILAVKIRHGKKRGSASSFEMKIRKIYKKLLQKHMKTSPVGWETPEELEQKVGFECHGKDRKFHELYEKARYSQQECGREELDWMVNYRKQKVGRK